jgi:predicted RNase H-like nuclease (RuvC/YqgF family)
MLQECNKFREHQAREVLIELMEKQLQERRKVIARLKDQVDKANQLLGVQDD